MLPIRVLCQNVGGGHMSGYQRMMSFWGEGIIVWIVLLIVIGATVYLVARNLHSSQTGDSSGNEAPLVILKKRYARGEITKDEFERIKQSL